MRVTTLSVMTLAVTSLGQALLPCAADARPANRAKPAVAEPTESAAARALRLALADDTGARRDADLHAPALQNAVVATGANSPERGPTSAAAPEPVRPAGPLSGALEELVARQMMRNAGAFDRCVAEAKARDPQLRGEVELTVQVAQRHASAAVMGGAAMDAGFSTCVSESAKTLKLSLPDLSFAWRLALGTGATAQR